MKFNDFRNMPSPACKKELLEFLNLLTNLLPFIPFLADKAYILSGLSKMKQCFYGKDTTINDLKISKQRLVKTQP